jgi:hypothetical protein
MHQLGTVKPLSAGSARRGFTLNRIALAPTFDIGNIYLNPMTQLSLDDAHLSDRTAVREGVKGTKNPNKKLNPFFKRRRRRTPTSNTTF